MTITIFDSLISIAQWGGAPRWKNVPLRGHPKTCRGRISWWQLNLERRSQLHNSQTCSVCEALVLAIGTSWYFWHSAFRLRVSLLFERIISDNPDHKMTAIEQHRLEKRRMHRHSCVSAILCERIYSETAQIGKAENAQILMCHRNPLWKDLQWNSTDWKSRERTDTRMCHRNPLKRI